jgi:hypothetical protein
LSLQHVRNPVNLLRGSLSDETLAGSDDIIFQLCRKFPEIVPRYGRRHQQRGSIMWGFLLNLIYRQCCRTSLLEMRKHYLAG